MSRISAEMVEFRHTWILQWKFLSPFSGLIDSAIGMEFCVHTLKMSAEVLMWFFFYFLRKITSQIWRQFQKIIFWLWGKKSKIPHIKPSADILRVCTQNSVPIALSIRPEKRLKNFHCMLKIPCIVYYKILRSSWCFIWPLDKVMQILRPSGLKRSLAVLWANRQKLCCKFRDGHDRPPILTDPNAALEWLPPALFLSSSGVNHARKIKLYIMAVNKDGQPSVCLGRGCGRKRSWASRGNCITYDVNSDATWW